MTVVASDDPMIDAALLDEHLDAPVRVADTATEERLLAAAEGAEALVVDVTTPVTESVLAALPDLTVVARAGVGVDNVDVPAADEHGVAVTNAPDYCTDEVATHTLALLLDCVRAVSGSDRSVREGAWDWNRRPLHRLPGTTLGLVSFGPIARAIARRVEGFDVDVVAHDPYVDADEMAAHGVEAVGFEQLLARADHVSLHAPLTEETRGLIDADALDAMQSHAVLVNTGRGGLVDEDALADALRERSIAAAGLDVLREEPPGPEHPLVGLDNCVVTPHAGWYSVEARRDLNESVARNVAAALAGERPPDRIDPDLDWL